jgi:hypothetical protein
LPSQKGIREKAQIEIEKADHLYREIRIENTLADENGTGVYLKEGAKVKVAARRPSQRIQSHQ